MIENNELPTNHVSGGKLTLSIGLNAVLRNAVNGNVEFIRGVFGVVAPK
jgi:hypothetical protein